MRFRPPAGVKNPWLALALRTRGLTCVGWSARGLERWSDEAEAVGRRVLRKRPAGLDLAAA
jgi:hypothetical protein